MAKGRCKKRCPVCGSTKTEIIRAPEPGVVRRCQCAVCKRLIWDQIDVPEIVDRVSGTGGL